MRVERETVHESEGEWERVERERVREREGEWERVERETVREVVSGTGGGYSAQVQEGRGRVSGTGG